MTGEEDRRTANDLPTELIATIAETAHILFSAGSVTDTLRAVVRLAVETIEGCDEAGIFLLEGDEVTTPVQTDSIVAEVDAAQHRYGEGPCLDAIGRGGSFYSDELADDARWPSFGQEASMIGIRSALAVNLHTTDLLGALNMYGRTPRAFGVSDRANALLLAAFAGLALASAEEHDQDARRFKNLELALVSREIIGQAQGFSWSANASPRTMHLTSCVTRPSTSTASSMRSPRISLILASDHRLAKNRRPSAASKSRPLKCGSMRKHQLGLDSKPRATVLRLRRKSGCSDESLVRIRRAKHRPYCASRD